MTDHTTCCCTKTLTDLRVLNAAYRLTCEAVAVCERDLRLMADRLDVAIAERDQARDTAARLEAELARLTEKK